MQRIAPNTELAPYVQDIFLLDNTDANEETEIPFYADGFPGIMWGLTDNPVILQPRGKQLSEFFLYGQTIEPISLRLKGCYHCIVFQLYPFAARLLLGVDPKVLNDDCFDLLQVTVADAQQTVAQLRSSDSTAAQIAIIARFINELVAHSSANPDHVVTMAVNSILSAKGQLTIAELRDRLHLSERTFERRFSREIGVSPKQFARIVQFSFSLNQIGEADYETLTEVGYDSGFADQSHFIRTFRKFTGMTPKEVLHRLPGSPTA